IWALHWEHSGHTLRLEGNFRAGEHEGAFLAVLPAGTSVTQVLCRTEEAERRARMLRRASDPTRHRGHQDARQTAPVPHCDTFLDLPGKRMEFAGDITPRAWEALLGALES